MRGSSLECAGELHNQLPMMEHSRDAESKGFPIKQTVSRSFVRASSDQQQQWPGRTSLGDRISEVREWLYVHDEKTELDLTVDRSW